MPLRERPVPVYRVHAAIVVLSVFLALLVQVVLPLAIPRARAIDLPLLVTLYFALLRRSKVFGIGLGALVGLLQDALSHHYIGLFGMSKTLVGYLAAWASVQFSLDELLARFIIAGLLIAVHAGFLLGLERALLDTAPPFVPLRMLGNVLVNAAAALILFRILDRFRQPA